MTDKDRLDSWKDIASYAQRSERTCFRWAKKFGFPVHRIDKSSRSARVFAYKNEIDEWLKGRPLLKR